jgi:hypothetical protein
MRYWMYDKRGRGDSGPMSMALWRADKAGGVDFEDNARPRVGAAMRVGTMSARSYQAQDWWQTTPIAEIIKDTPEEVVFRTRSGSEYTWKII